MAAQQNLVKLQTSFSRFLSLNCSARDASCQVAPKEEEHIKQIESIEVHQGTTMTHTRLSPLLALLLLLSVCLDQLLAAPIICGDDAVAAAKADSDGATTEAATTTKPSELNQFLHNMQCTLEKAKPWIDDLEKEAKRLEETAKRVGLSIVHRFGDLMDSLLGAAANRRPNSTSNATATDAAPSSSPTPTVHIEAITEADQLLESSSSTKLP